jgi:hypothetical protein
MESSDLIFVMSEVVNGQFSPVGQVNKSLTNIAQSLIEQNSIVFIHAGNHQAPSYTLVVTDGTLQSVPSIPLISFSNAPVLQSNQITIEQSQSIVLNASNFNASVSSVNDPTAIQFTLTHVAHGYVTVNGVSANQFTQEALNAGEVRFIQDGTGNTPSYEVAVTNIAGGSSTATQSGNVLFQNAAGVYAPRIKANQLFIRQGDTRILTTSDLQAVDQFNQPISSDTQWIPMNVQHGNFYFSGETTLSPPAFTQ